MFDDIAIFWYYRRQAILPEQGK